MLPIEPSNLHINWLNLPTSDLWRGGDRIFSRKSINMKNDPWMGGRRSKTEATSHLRDVIFCAWVNNNSTPELVTTQRHNITNPPAAKQSATM